ncbi:MAG: hypothetical protein LUQ59_11755 [Methanothrix sp.]|nr:hypothetical protein [Methanothrix sp.]
MHIHLPKGHLSSLRGWLLELLTITCGILIALSLEGMGEWRHNRQLLHEARTNILAELRDNHRSISNPLEVIPDELANLRRVITLCRQERARRGSVDLKKEENLSLAFTLATVSSTSWNTAQAIGAVSLMDYQEIKKYTAVYEIQAETMAIQRQTMDKWLQVQRVASLLGDPPSLKDVSTSDIADIERGASEAISYTSALRTLETELQKQYEGLLEPRTD